MNEQEREAWETVKEFRGDVLQSCESQGYLPKETARQVGLFDAALTYLKKRSEEKDRVIEAARGMFQTGRASGHMKHLREALAALDSLVSERDELDMHNHKLAADLVRTDAENQRLREIIGDGPLFNVDADAV